METYTVTIIANGDEEQAKAIVQTCADALMAAGHQVMQASLCRDRGGESEFVSAETIAAARKAVADDVLAAAIVP